MWKFLAGLVAGAVLSILYVIYNIQLPEFMQIPGLVRGGIISSTTEQQLYDLGSDVEARQRALVVYFDNRAGDAAELDASVGHPFLTALHRARATREARLLSGQWDAFDQALAQPALRDALVRRHGVTEDLALKQAMLWSALDDYPFLKQWIVLHYGAQRPATLYDTLVDARRDPSLSAPATP